MMEMPQQVRHDTLLPSYGRSRGRRLRPGRQELIEEMLPRLQLKPKEMKNWRIEELGKRLFDSSIHQFSNSSIPIFLEIGFGAGEHLAHQAALHPDVGIIGCEPFINGVATLLAHIHDQALNNIRIYNGDARLLIEQLPDASLDRVFILYADPWPKARHHKRRLVSTEFLDNVARVMKPGAELLLATDDTDYLTWMLERLLIHPSFQWMAKSCDDWLTPWQDWVSTRYELKAVKAGRVPTYLRFICHPEHSEGSCPAA